jgi:hypothetical protein
MVLIFYFELSEVAKVESFRVFVKFTITKKAAPGGTAFMNQYEMYF